MSLDTEVILGNAESECAKLGRAAMLDALDEYAVAEDICDDEKEALKADEDEDARLELDIAASICTV